jgi:hypothetical protein
MLFKVMIDLHLVLRLDYHRFPKKRISFVKIQKKTAEEQTAEN